MKRPLVSVVIPSYNHERFVAQAIDSVFAQTYPELELIVVDDGSKDASKRVIREGLSRAPARIKTSFFARKNGGAHKAISFGLSKASGEYLTILNSDDYFHPERIEALAKAAAGSESELLFSLLEMVSETGERLSGSVREVLWYHEAVSLRHYLPALGFALLRDNLAVTTGNLFFTKRLFKKIGPFRAFRYMHDIDFILRALVHTEPKLISKNLLYYRLHGTNAIRSTRDGYDEEGRRILDDYLRVAMKGRMPNRFAPCPAQWPHYFNRFIAEEHPFFSTSKIGQYLEQSGDAALRPSSTLPGGITLRRQTLPSLTGASIHLLDPAKKPVLPLALLRHSFRDELGKARTRIGVRHFVRLSAPARKATAVALVHEDRILATAKPGKVTQGGVDCTFVVSSEFGSTDLSRTRFVALEESGDYPSGVAYHARDAATDRARLEPSPSSGLEPARALIGERTYAVRAAGADGRIDRIRPTPEGDWILEGSAFDSGSGEVPSGVVLFDGDSRLRARYESRFQSRSNGSSDRAGFKLVVPRSQLRGPGTSLIRAIAFFRRGIAFHLGLIERKGSALSRTVRPIDTLAGQMGRISRTAKGWRYEHPKGKREWLTGEWRYGYIDLIDRNPARVSVHGWAFEPPTGVVSEAILVTADGKPVAFARPNCERMDLMSAHKLQAPMIAGYRFDLDPAHCLAEIRVFALWPSGVATELPLYGARSAPKLRPHRVPKGLSPPELTLQSP